MIEIRADKLLFERELAKSRTQAAILIDNGIVYADGNLILRPSEDIKETADLEIRGEKPRYVSRGGYKLEAALRAFSLNPSGCVAIDFGASTGGFTDCLLQHGAKKVFAVDSGHDQFDPLLRDHPFIVHLERTNARYLTPDIIGELCDFAVLDLSFISQTLIHPIVFELLKANGYFISLIKPQFEVGKSKLSKGGIVKEERFRREAVETVCASAVACGFYFRAIIPSPIKGKDGNVEFLACFQKHDSDG